MNSSIYNELYIISSEDFFSEVEYNEKFFLFQGSKNWCIYLCSKPKSLEYDIIKNVKLLTFKSKDIFLEYLQNKNVIDYSLEHIDELGYLILAYNEN